MPVRIVTWNVNGIRNPFKYLPWNKDRSLQAMFDILEADIVCFQEVKTPKSSLTDDLVFVNGWDTFYSFPHSQTGYSGVAVYTRDSKCIPIRVEEGVTGVLKVPGSQTRYRDLPAEDQIGGYPTDKQLRRAAVNREAVDVEGRCLIVEFPLFVLLNVYCPARRNHERTGYRNAFLLALDARVRNLAALGKNIVLCGDFNIIRDQLDTAGIWGHQGQKLVAEALEFDEGYMTSWSPKLLNQLLFNSRQFTDAGNPIIDEKVERRRPPVLYDACRELHPQRTGMFTCWDTKKNHRPANHGSRIDLILCSPKLMQLVAEADIQANLLGSDHCPVYVVLRDSIEDVDASKSIHVLDFLNPRGRFVDGQLRLQTDEDAVLLKRFPQSARRMPQFSNRRTIANMFKQTTRTNTPQVSSIAPEKAKSNVSASVQTLCQELPEIFKADPIEIIESSDNEEDSTIEEDEPPAIVGEEVESESATEVLVSPQQEKKRYFAENSTGRKEANQTHPELHRSSSSAESHLAKENIAATAPAVGSEFTDLPFEREETAVDDSDFDSNQALSSLSASGSSTMLPPRPKATTRQGPTRSRSAAGPNASLSSSRPAKKAKTTTGFQTSINMFLQAQDATQDQDRRHSRAQPQTQPQAQQHGDGSQTQSADNSNRADVDNSSPPPNSKASPGLLIPPDSVLDDAVELVANMDAAKKTWSKLGLGQHQAPLCEHGEPCKMFVTKKAGVNSGRSFYMCARPPGPLGRREKGTAWQCTTFVWCRDWKPDRKT